MKRIYLVRHGQASDDILNYDDLSALGGQQLVALGRFYRHRLDDCRLYSGNMVRHQKSLASFLEGAGVSAPINEEPRLNEFDFMDIVRQYVPAWREIDQLRADLAEQPSPDRFFLRVFREALLQWLEHPDGQPYLESWNDFQHRTAGVINNLSPDHNHWLFTSGGVVAALVADALGLNPAQMIRLNLNLANASVTTFQAVKGRWRLLSINQIQHFDDSPNLVTFR